ncbi:MAG: hypothetical protein ACR2J8_02620 [Thermomicrobiales bacterium]
MHESNDRRAFVERVAAAIAGMGAAGVAGTADAKHGHKKPTMYSFSGTFSKPHYRVDPERGDPHYIITFRQKEDMSLRQTGRKGQRDMSGQEMEDIMRGMSKKGDLKGRPSIRIENINWRLHRASFDETTDKWRLHASICPTNPNSRPKLEAAGAEGGPEAEYTPMKISGCGCSACQNCYRCMDGTRYCTVDSNYCNG